MESNFYIEELGRRKQFREPQLLRTAFYKLKNSHRTFQSISYVRKCFDLNLEPKFLKISEKNKKQLGLNKGEIFKLRKRRLLKEQNALNEKLK